MDRNRTGAVVDNERELFRQGEYDRRWKAIHQMIGDRHVSRRTPVLNSKSGGGTVFPQAADSGPDTLDVLIIRIAFEENRDPHLTTVDPSGDFVLEPDPDPPVIPVDPPPRDKAFFEAHLAGLSEYYDFQSGGRLHIEGRVLPDGDRDSYKLSDIADYGPGEGNFWSIESLEVFVRDMIAKADQETQADGSVNLADYGDGFDDATTGVAASGIVGALVTLALAVGCAILSLCTCNQVHGCHDLQKTG